MVDRIPEPRRSAVLARFADCAERLQDAGLAAEYLSDPKPIPPEQIRDMSSRYMALGLVCPFLEDEACGIYPDRPFVCREYLVNSPKELCANPLSGMVKTIPIVLELAAITLELAAAITGRAQRTVPLTLLLVYAQAHREELEQSYPSNQLWYQAMGKLLSAAHRCADPPSGMDPPSHSKLIDK
jgi:Fe-S-cluster containining protein